MTDQLGATDQTGKFTGGRGSGLGPGLGVHWAGSSGMGLGALPGVRALHAAARSSPPAVVQHPIRLRCSLLPAFASSRERLTHVEPLRAGVTVRTVGVLGRPRPPPRGTGYQYQCLGPTLLDQITPRRMRPEGRAGRQNLFSSGRAFPASKDTGDPPSPRRSGGAWAQGGCA